MKLTEYVKKDKWTNITEFLNVCMSNLCDGVEWTIHFSLYVDTEKEAVTGQEPIVLTHDGLKTNNNHRDFHLRLIRTKPAQNEYQHSDFGFMLLAKRKVI